ncbi:MAG: iron(III) ABC transporter [Gammaproteobacteria bacterium]|nr:iron(III) ABC transporter [Gammaproteobacteria bacterium]
MRWFVCALIILLSGCQAVSMPQRDHAATKSATEDALPEWQSPRAREHPRVGHILDLRTGARVTLPQLLAELADAPLVLLGEKHDNPDHHALQLWLIQALDARRAQGSVVLEMLTVNQQERVNHLQKQVRAGRVPTDLPAALDWHTGWDWQQYGDLVSYLVPQSYPLLAGNLNRDALMEIYRNPPKLSGIASTGEDVRLRLSAQIRESHCHTLAEAQLPAMLAVQQQRDRSMATVMLAAPRPTLLIAGAYHVRYDLGIPLHIQDLHREGASQQRVLIFAEADQAIDTSSADFVWYTPAVEEQDYCANL